MIMIQYKNNPSMVNSIWGYFFILATNNPQ